MTPQTRITGNQERPEWLEDGEIVTSLDWPSISSKNENAILQAVAGLKKLHQGEIFKITASTLPSELIKQGTSLGFEHYVEEGKKGVVKVYFRG